MVIPTFHSLQSSLFISNVFKVVSVPAGPARGLGFELKPEDVRQVCGRRVGQFSGRHCAVDRHEPVRRTQIELLHRVGVLCVVRAVDVHVVVSKDNPLLLPH